MVGVGDACSNLTRVRCSNACVVDCCPAMSELYLLVYIGHVAVLPCAFRCAVLPVDCSSALGFVSIDLASSSATLPAREFARCDASLKFLTDAFSEYSAPFLATPLSIALNLLAMRVLHGI
jgi:hypothetical protein